ncbi:MAG TPA: formimidoylglutamate deiminase [Dongiaceae bacterium]|jgi:formimidoylglutamate deiminase|nr:formimidoylglutamate deiminase [Dongiaceae bacterium]
MELWASHVFLGSRWAQDAVLAIDPRGTIAAIEEGVAPRGEAYHAMLIPAMPNLHSHAFQRAFAGLAERAHGEDDFWSWREAMYRLAGEMTPERLHAIARLVYIEMLLCGYGAVAEFHYVHGNAPVAMMAALQAAAEEAGIGLTLLPVFYAHGGFGGAPPQPAQRRFVLALDSYARLFQDVAGPKGLCFHSLRAVTLEEMRSLLPLAKDIPVHLHIAEQPGEVEAVRTVTGVGPIRYLLDHVPIDEHWCLVHATHAEEHEIAAVARSGAVIGLCPTTEANLGDGLFPAESLLAHGGAWGIGSDSHVTLDPAQELRLLEYGQRLVRGRRGVLHDSEGRVADYLYGAALAGGSQALGRPPSSLAPGAPADLVVLDENSWARGPADQRFSQALFGAARWPVRHVMIGGRWRVRDGHHPLQARAAESVRGLLAELD